MDACGDHEKADAAQERITVPHLSLYITMGRPCRHHTAALTCSRQGRHLHAPDTALRSRNRTGIKSTRLKDWHTSLSDSFISCTRPATPACFT